MATPEAVQQAAGLLTPMWNSPWVLCELMVNAYPDLGGEEAADDLARAAWTTWTGLWCRQLRGR